MLHILREFFLQKEILYCIINIGTILYLAADSQVSVGWLWQLVKPHFFKETKMGLFRKKESRIDAGFRVVGKLYVAGATLALLHIGWRKVRSMYEDHQSLQLREEQRIADARIAYEAAEQDRREVQAEVERLDSLLGEDVSDADRSIARARLDAAITLETELHRFTY